MQVCFNQYGDMERTLLHNGNVDSVDVWGRRKMTYMIRKQLEGQYVLLNASMLPSATAELERKLRLLEPVMRHMLVLVN